MLIFNPKQMAIATGERKVGKKVFILGIFIIVVSIVGALLDVLFTVPVSTLDYFSKGFMIANTILWFLVAYIANNKGDGRDFWYRFININIPITVLLLILTSILGIIFGVLISKNTLLTPLLEFYFTPIILIGYIALYHYMKIASRGK